MSGVLVVHGKPRGTGKVSLGSSRVVGVGGDRTIQEGTLQQRRWDEEIVIRPSQRKYNVKQIGKSKVRNSITGKTNTAKSII
jgi:hypothetical protein